MRILYVDFDSLRPDHLGCYGYHRNTSPNIDRIAAEGVRFTRCHVSDAPCLPSRTSLFSGRFGIHTGVVNHGGVAAQPFIEGPTRQFRDSFGATCWMSALRKLGYYTATCSPFGERHSAWWWYAGQNEILNSGKGGMESAHEVSPHALGWLKRNASKENWFLHVNFWDPHTPYRSPRETIEQWKDSPIPDWYTQDVLSQHRDACGPHSARHPRGWLHNSDRGLWPSQPTAIENMLHAREMFDGYDGGVFYADQHFGLLLDELQRQGLLEDTAIILSADHGENLAELNIYGDHQTADLITTRVPLIIRWPGITDEQAGRVDDAYTYANDMAATVIELAGGEVPDNWDGDSFAEGFKLGQSGGRDYLVVSQGAWSCQRGVRFTSNGRDYICIRSYHDGYHGFPETMLFDIENDPHEQHNLAPTMPEMVERAMGLLDDWYTEMRRTATHPDDPMWTVLHEGGAYHTRGQLPGYLKELREHGLEMWADHLEARYPKEAKGPIVGAR